MSERLKNKGENGDYEASKSSFNKINPKFSELKEELEKKDIDDLLSTLKDDNEGCVFCCKFEKLHKLVFDDKIKESLSFLIESMKEHMRDFCKITISIPSVSNICASWFKDENHPNKCLFDAFLGHGQLITCAKTEYEKEIFEILPNEINEIEKTLDDFETEMISYRKFIRYDFHLKKILLLCGKIELVKQSFTLTLQKKLDRDQKDIIDELLIEIYFIIFLIQQERRENNICRVNKTDISVMKVYFDKNKNKVNVLRDLNGMMKYAYYIFNLNKHKNKTIYIMSIYGINGFLFSELSKIILNNHKSYIKKEKKTQIRERVDLILHQSIVAI